MRRVYEQDEQMLFCAGGTVPVAHRESNPVSLRSVSFAIVVLFTPVQITPLLSTLPPRFIRHRRRFGSAPHQFFASLLSGRGLLKQYCSSRCPSCTGDSILSRPYAAECIPWPVHRSDHRKDISSRRASSRSRIQKAYSIERIVSLDFIICYAG